MNIKINAQGITNLSAARYYAVFADFMSFNIVPQSANFVNSATIKNCLGWISGVRGVLQAGAMPVLEACEVALGLGIDMLETDLLLTPYELSRISGGVSIIQNVRVASYEDLGGLQNALLSTRQYSAYHILNFENMDVQGLDIEFFRGLKNKGFNIFYNLGLQNGNLEGFKKVLDFLEPMGVCLPNILETETGICDFELVNEVVDFLDSRF